MTNALSTLQKSPQKYFVLAAFLILVIGAGSVIGIATAPGEWYAGIDKPPFNPPNWIFAPVWTFLYICIAIAGWRTWMRAPESRAMKLWVGQLVLNWLWSPVFFSLHLLWPAALVILSIATLIVWFISEAGKNDRISAILFVPYLAWVSFASLLNISIAVLN